MAPLRPGQIAPSQDNPEASVDTHTQDSLRGQASVCSQMTEEGPCHDLNMEEAGWARAGPGGGEEGWVPAGLAYPWPSWGAGGPPGDGVKLPFSTEGLLLEGAFRAQRGGGQRAPRTRFAQAWDPPHHLLSTGGQDRNQTGLGHELPEAVLLCGGRGSIQACDRALLGPDKRHQLPATESKECACGCERVCVCLYASCVCVSVYI